MRIPKTTPDKPYIEFRVYKNGKVKLSATSSYWCGNKFICNDGSTGSTCKPSLLTASVNEFKQKLIKDIEKEISSLQKEIDALKNTPFVVDSTAKPSKKAKK
jgi:hypothetical protein